MGDLYTGYHPELASCITTLTVRNRLQTFFAAVDTLIDQDDWICETIFCQ